MKRTLCCILACLFLVTLLPCAVSADAYKTHYTQEQMVKISEKYFVEEEMMDPLFCHDSAIGYWGMIHKIQSKPFYAGILDAASWAIGEYPNKEDYAEILANLITLQSGRLADQVMYQSRFDDLKKDGDYLIDIASIAADIIGASKVLGVYDPVLDAVTGGNNLIAKNKETAKYYEAVLMDYVQAEAFLAAISTYAEAKPLRHAAESLSKANKELLTYRIDYLADLSENSLEYTSQFLFKNLSFSELKGSALYKSDKSVKAFVDCSERLNKDILPALGSGDIAFKITILMGDFAFGTTNTYNRYQEMRTLSDIADSLVQAKNAVSIPSKVGQSQMEAIKTCCDYYSALFATHARGEYLMYQLVTQDAEGLSAAHQIAEHFDSQGKTSQQWYNGQVDVLVEYSELVDRLFIVPFSIQEEVPSQIPEAPEQPITPGQKPESLSNTPYEALLDMYHSNISDNWTALDGDGWDNVYDPDNVSYVLSWMNADCTTSEIGYQLLDLDGNGQDELLIADIYNAPAGGFHDLYTIHNGNVIHLATGSERDIYQLAVNNTILNRGSSGAAYSTTANYRVDAGTEKLTVINAVITEDSDHYLAEQDFIDPSTYEYQYAHMTEISLEEARKTIQAMPQEVPLNLTLFSEYKSVPTVSRTEDAPLFTEEEAYEIACDYWNYTEGDVAPETGYALYVQSEYDMLQTDAATGTPYYSFMLRWLVTGENGEQWMSTCDIIHVDAITGECTFF